MTITCVKCPGCKMSCYICYIEGNVMYLSCLACGREIRYTVVPDLLSIPDQSTEGHES